MSNIKINNSVYENAEFVNEDELEEAISSLSKDIFGINRIYLNIKKKIGSNIPDGYLIDFNTKVPSLFIVEVELDVHHSTKHIASQLLEFSISVDSEKKRLKDILIEAINSNSEYKSFCEEFIKNKNISSMDKLIDDLAFNQDFRVLLIIDKLDEKLETILNDKLNFEVEILEIKKFENSESEKIYEYDNFKEQVYVESTSSTRISTIDNKEFDTIIVPARKEGFESVFIGENRWYQIRIHKSIQQQLRYIAVYQIRPVSAITHIAEVENIKPWEDTGKYVVNFKDKANEIEPIKLVHGGKVKTLQSSRYASHEKLIKAKTLDDIW